jgi:murein L,D-transpeptidase YcbB/YkuD
VGNATAPDDTGDDTFGALGNATAPDDTGDDTFGALVGGQIREELEGAASRRGHTVLGERVRSGGDLFRFYEGRGYRPAWLIGSGPRLEPFILLWSLSDARSEGLDPGDYHVDRLRELTGEAFPAPGDGMDPDEARLARLDILMSDAFLTYARHVGNGRVSPEDIEQFTGAARDGPDLAGLLGESLDNGRLDEVLNELPPPHPGYGGLREALARYRRIAARGGWALIPEGPAMRAGDTGERVRALRQRLTVSGELDPEEDKDEPGTFGPALEAALMRFQFSHGIESDGIAGDETLAALNVPVEDRIEQIRVNMERWRWLPRDLGERHILVDIAAFELSVVEGGGTVMSMEAIVGKAYRNTPVFSGTMTHMVLGPSWNVPRTIAVEDKLPRIQKDPEYLRRHGYEVFAIGDPDAGPLDPATIDWTELDEEHFPYRLRQKPGPGNALGRVKFMFPNEHAVYIHDTPERKLFNRSVRMFSSGCIRISRPIELAEYLLNDKPGWGRHKILRAFIRWNELTVKITPVPIHLVYFTARANGDGTLEFRKDVYRRDATLGEALLPGGLEATDK